jgi:hypothetical protein
VGAYSSEDAPVIWGQIADILDVQLHTGGVSGVSVVVVVVFARVRTGRLGILEGSRKSELAPLVIGGRELGMAGREVQVQSCLHLQQLTHYASALHPPFPHTFRWSASRSLAGPGRFRDPLHRYRYSPPSYIPTSPLALATTRNQHGEGRREEAHGC